MSDISAVKRHYCQVTFTAPYDKNLHFFIEDSQAKDVLFTTCNQVRVVLQSFGLILLIYYLNSLKHFIEVKNAK
jgi:hypothetical protein